jgi:hypothetical protein
MMSSTSTGEVRGCRYRWIVLGARMTVDTILPGLWIGCAPVASLWGMSEVQVGRWAMTFMYVYLVTSLPASWAPERFGFHTGVGVAAVVMGVAAVLRRAYALAYPIVLAATFGLVVTQPFVVNASTKLVARWFPTHERSTVLGVSFESPVMRVALGSGRPRRRAHA